MPGPEDEKKDTGLRLDTDAWNLIYGDPTQQSGYFIGGAGQKGARWATNNGGFTGNANEDGLKSHIGLGGENSLELSGDFKQQMGQIGMSSGGAEMFNLYGKGSGLDNYETGIRGSYGVGGGFQLDPSLAYLHNGDKDNETARLALKNGDTSFNSALSTGDDGTKLNLGLTEGMGPGITSTRGASWNFGNNTAENSFQLKDPSNTYGFNQSFGPGGEKDTLSFAHRYGSGDMNGSLSMMNGGSGVEGFSLGANQTLGGAGSLHERFGMNFGPNGPTTNLGMGYDLKDGGFSLGTNFDAKIGPGSAYDVTGKLNEGYRSKGFGESLSLGGTSSSEKGESFNATGSATAQLLPGVYGSGFGNFTGGSSVDPSYFAGGGLTYMPSDKFGITAAGGYGSEGWEGRLQADFFKKGIGGAGDLEDQRKKAMVSAYLGVSQGGTHMNDVYGAGNMDKSWGGNGGPTFTAGIGVGF